MSIRLITEAAGAMLFLFYLGRGRQAEALRRCSACGSKYGEKHHRDCHYKEDR